MIIDFHTHIFPDKIAGKTIEILQAKSRSMPYTDATATGLISSMKEAGINYCVTLPVATNVKQVEKLNTLAIDSLASQETTGLIPFGAMHPDYENPSSEFKRLHAAGVKGIKIHPAYQGADFDDLRFKRMLAAASEEDLIVVTHAGWDIGIPEKDYASVDHVLNIVRDVAPTKLVLAHMGGWTNWDMVEEKLADVNVWFDTSFSLGEIRPAKGTTRTPEESFNMSPERFVKLVKALGTSKILFATDCPWSDQKEYVDMFADMDFTEEEKQAILGGNAQKLLGM